MPPRQRCPRHISPAIHKACYGTRRRRYFLAVADAGTFRAAAEIPHVPQPALSQQIELRFTLFQRGTRRVTLGAAARVREVHSAIVTWRRHPPHRPER